MLVEITSLQNMQHLLNFSCIIYMVRQAKTLSSDFPHRNVTAARVALESYKAAALAGAGAAAIAQGLDPAEESRWIAEARVHLPG